MTQFLGVLLQSTPMEFVLQGLARVENHFGVKIIQEAEDSNFK
jgi:hypothetical protein